MLEGYHTKVGAVAMAESIAEVERNDEQLVENMAAQMYEDRVTPANQNRTIPME